MTDKLCSTCAMLPSNGDMLKKEKKARQKLTQWMNSVTALKNSRLYFLMVVFTGGVACYLDTCGQKKKKKNPRKTYFRQTKCNQIYYWHRDMDKINILSKSMQLFKNDKIWGFGIALQHPVSKHMHFPAYMWHLPPPPLNYSNRLLVLLIKQSLQNHRITWNLDLAHKE